MSTKFWEAATRESKSSNWKDSKHDLLIASLSYSQIILNVMKTVSINSKEKDRKYQQDVNIFLLHDAFYMCTADGLGVQKFNSL